MRYDTAVVIGRFQPMHKAHEHLIREALQVADKVIVLVGSAMLPRTYKNPWTYQEREAMINSVFYSSDKPVLIRPIIDTPYNDTVWIRSVQQTVHDANAQCGTPDGSVVLVGHTKDDSSYYLSMFPQWAYLEVDTVEPLNATSVRELYFKDDFNLNFLVGVVSTEVLNRLSDFVASDHYEEVKRERMFIEEYKRQFSSIPYPMTFVTVDAVVVCLGHVLMVKRDKFPGRGLLALPGGFLDANGDKTLVDAAVRELKEETNIKLPAKTLRKLIVDSEVFDGIDRSLRGRTITHAFFIELSDATLPKVAGGDDARSAHWVPVGEVESEQCFEDHFQIIQHFIGA